jgi:hypothetical protein
MRVTQQTSNVKISEFVKLEYANICLAHVSSFRRSNSSPDSLSSLSEHPLFLCSGGIDNRK